MKRYLTLLAVVLTATLIVVPHAEARLKHDSRAWRICKVNRAGPRYNHEDVKRTIRCAVDHWSVQGGVRKSVCIARRESGLGAHASNGGRYLGVYQHAREYWPGRQNNYDKRNPALRNIRESAFNARSNVLVSIKMAHANGWGPWSTSGGC